jgi:hypothetical protein
MSLHKVCTNPTAPRSTPKGKQQVGDEAEIFSLA